MRKINHEKQVLQSQYRKRMNLLVAIKEKKDKIENLQSSLDTEVKALNSLEEKIKIREREIRSLEENISQEPDIDLTQKEYKGQWIQYKEIIEKTIDPQYFDAPILEQYLQDCEYFGLNFSDQIPSKLRRKQSSI